MQSQHPKVSILLMQMINIPRKKSGRKSYSKQPQKNLGIKLTKEVKAFYNKNFKALEKEIEEDTRRQNDLPCSWADWINVVKAAILPKSIYRLKTIPIKILMQFFIEIEKNLKFLMGKQLSFPTSSFLLGFLKSFTFLLRFLS